MSVGSLCVCVSDLLSRFLLCLWPCRSRLDSLLLPNYDLDYDAFESAALLVEITRFFKLRSVTSCMFTPSKGEMIDDVHQNSSCLLWLRKMLSNSPGDVIRVNFIPDDSEITEPELYTVGIIARQEVSLKRVASWEMKDPAFSWFTTLKLSKPVFN